jgi:hypothetical protein
MPSFNPAAYGSAIEALLRRQQLNPLDAGQADVSARPQLEAISNESLRVKTSAGENMASACRAGLWLRCNFLDESHKISQDIETSEGSFWHGILHRREGDFDNAKYWFRRVGTHAVYEPLCQAAAELAADSADPRSAFLVKQKTWDPFAFVDLCADAVRGKAACGPLCEQIQQREWELLFDYCWRAR